MSVALSTAGLSKRFGKDYVLEDVSLQVGAGEFHVLLGPSGCGKTTLLRCLSGLETPDRGEIHIGDTMVEGPILHLSPADRGLGFVFQDLGLWPSMTVMEHLLFVLGGQRSAEHRQRASDQLSALQMSSLAQKRPAQLSGGEAQRLALARALVTQPKLLLLDEPLASLDPAVAQEVRSLLAEIHHQVDTTMIYVTHSQSEAFELADRASLMHSGKIQQTGTLAELFHRPQSAFVATFLGQGMLLPGQYRDEGATFDCALGRFTTTAEQRELRNPAVVLREHVLQVRPEKTAPAFPVVASRFFGSYWSTTVQIGDQTYCLRDDQQRHQGEQVVLEMDPELWLVENEIEVRS